MPTILNDAMVTEHLPLVRAIALSIRARIPHHFELDDLISAGTIGLLDAFAKFDEGKAASFSTYARFRIRGAIIDTLRLQDSASRTLRSTLRTAATVEKRLDSELGRFPTTEEIAKDMHIPEQELLQLRARARSASVIDGGMIRSAAIDHEINILARGVDADPFAQFAYKETRNIVAEALACLDKRHRWVVLESYFEGRSVMQIAGEIGVHQSRIFQLRHEALTTLGKKLRKAGVHSVLAACA